MSLCALRSARWEDGEAVDLTAVVVIGGWFKKAPLKWTVARDLWSYLPVCRDARICFRKFPETVCWRVNIPASFYIIGALYLVP